MKVTRLPPGVTFSVMHDLDSPPNQKFKLAYKTKDVNNPEHDLTINLFREIEGASYHESLLPEILADMLKELFTHEIKEWLTIDNKRWREPH